MKIRLIPRLDVKGPNVVKGICFEGLRIIGKPAELAKKYYLQGADEILYIDTVASLYGRRNLINIVKETVEGVFVPITVGGGVRTLEDIKELLRAGADKVAINTAATKNPRFITDAAEMFGSQCIVGSIEAKDKGNGKWEAYIDNGRECTGLDAVEWAKKLVSLGAGELLATSIDRDGTKKGYDIELIKKIVGEVTVPVIACGGAGNKEDIYTCLKETKCDALSFATILHYNLATIDSVKELLAINNLPIRKINMQNLLKNKPNQQKKTVSIIDYNVGNIKSIISAFGTIGHSCKLVSTKEEILSSELLVLPGDGAFGYAMKELRRLDLIDPISEYAKTGKPLLGICLGMQLLMTESEEFGNHKGLDIIRGKVLKLNPQNKGEESLRVPHMGWNTLIKPAGIQWENTVLDGILENSEVYFVHSYHTVPEDKDTILSKTRYGSQELCTVIKKDNIYGMQFHPEKSGEIGLSMLYHFSTLGRVNKK